MQPSKRQWQWRHHPPQLHPTCPRLTSKKATRTHTNPAIVTSHVSGCQAREALCRNVHGHGFTRACFLAWSGFLSLVPGRPVNTSWCSFRKFWEPLRKIWWLSQNFTALLRSPDSFLQPFALARWICDFLKRSHGSFCSQGRRAKLE